MHTTEPIPLLPVTGCDREMLTKFLGRRPTGVMAVAKRCSAGHPCVVVSKPLRRVRGQITPFPTLLWLTCPHLSYQLSQLEQQGMIATIEKIIAGDLLMQDRLRQSHRDCINARWALISGDERSLIEQRGWRATLESRGIAGMRDWTKVKCLHAHYAQHLVAGNAIGQWIDEQVGISPCKVQAVHA